MAEELNTQEIMFWLKTGMGLQEDKRFLLSIVADQKKQIETAESWQKHANSEYDKMRMKYEALRARVALSISDMSENGGVPKPTTQEDLTQKAVQGEFEGIDFLNAPTA